MTASSWVQPTARIESRCNEALERDLERGETDGISPNVFYLATARSMRKVKQPAVVLLTCR